jgi:hypothetical protein
MEGNMVERLICGDCKSSFTVEAGKRGSAFIEFFLWSTLVIPGFFYSMWRKRKPKKSCDYCGSTFLLPDSYSTHELLRAHSESSNCDGRLAQLPTLPLLDVCLNTPPLRVSEAVPSASSQRDSEWALKPIVKNKNS